MKLEDVVKSNIAIEALYHVVKRAELFNEMYFPVEITKIGIGGSSLRDEKPRDIDISVEARIKKEIYLEWEEFKEILDRNTFRLYELSLELTNIYGRSDILTLIEHFYHELVYLGFKKHWIANWLPWVRISDIKYGYDRGVLDTYFNLEELISRFLKAHWHKKRIEIHFQVQGKEKLHKFDSITVWDNNSGFLDIDEKELEKYFHLEFKKLKKIIIEIGRGIKSNDPHDFIGILIYQPTQFVIAGLHVPEGFSSFEEQLKKIALDYFNTMQKLIRKRKESKQKINNLLRTYLKLFALVGLIAEKVEKMGKYELIDLFEQGEGEKSLIELLTKRLRSEGYKKDEIETIISKIDFNPVLAELKSI